MRNKMDQIISNVKKRKPSFMNKQHYAAFSVFLPLLEIDNEIHILFEVRAKHLRRQPGEICFPGGKIDLEDKNEQGAAIRETIEELGIERKDIKDIAPLDYMITPFGSVIYPFVGTITSQHIVPNEDEVEEVFTVPLSYLLSQKPESYEVHFKIEPEDDFPFHLVNGGKEYDWRARGLEEYFYFYHDFVIWGLTAKVLRHFLQIYGGFTKK